MRWAHPGAFRGGKDFWNGTKGAKTATVKQPNPSGVKRGTFSAWP